MSADSVSEAIPQPIVVKFGDNEFTVSPLALADLAKVEAYLRGERLNQFLETTRMVKGVNLADKVRADSIGAIMNYTLSFDEVVSSFEGGLYLLYLSLKKTNPALQLTEMQNLEPMLLTTLSNIMYRITGLITPEATQGDPLEEKTTTQTTTEETSIRTFQGGESTLQE